MALRRPFPQGAHGGKHRPLGWASYTHALSKAAGHEISIRAHDLRHTYCTMLCDAGVPMKQAMEWLGHADQQMILRVYDHNTDARRAAATQAVEDHLSGVKTGVKRTRTRSKPA